MKVLGIITTTAMFLLLGAAVPAFAQEEHQEEGAKPAQHEEQPKPAPKQEEAKPQKQEQQAKGQQQEEKQQQQQARTRQQQDTKQQQQQVKAQQNEEKSQQRQQQANSHTQESQGQYARNGQKDTYGHVYTESHFGPNHHARFEENGGRYYNGRREYSYGGYWFYAGAYPAWFYQQDVYFIMGADGLWYAVAIGNPSLRLQVYIA